MGVLPPNPHFLYFNSIKVRLELASKNAYDSLHEFQFHKGTIRTVITKAVNGVIMYFNSIKVRLELERKYFCSDYIIFQFHKGTIRTYNKWLLRLHILISIP